MSSPPKCEGCGQPLNRIDTIGVEHMILDRRSDVFRPVNVEEGLDGQPGIASDMALACGLCGWELRPDQKRFYYERHWQLVEINKRGSL